MPLLQLRCQFEAAHTLAVECQIAATELNIGIRLLQGATQQNLPLQGTGGPGLQLARLDKVEFQLSRQLLLQLRPAMYAVITQAHVQHWQLPVLTLASRLQLCLERLLTQPAT